MPPPWCKTSRCLVGTPVAFAPDHGAHINPSTGKGDHGLDIPEDMDIFHCYGIYPGGKKKMGPISEVST
jgi:hypothetical protein